MHSVDALMRVIVILIIITRNSVWVCGLNSKWYVVSGRGGDKRKTAQLMCTTNQWWLYKLHRALRWIIYRSIISYKVNIELAGFSYIHGSYVYRTQIHTHTHSACPHLLDQGCLGHIFAVCGWRCVPPPPLQRRSLTLIVYCWYFQTVSLLT